MRQPPSFLLSNINTFSLFLISILCFKDFHKTVYTQQVPVYQATKPTTALETMSVSNDASASALPNAVVENGSFENILNFRDVGKTINDFVGKR